MSRRNGIILTVVAAVALVAAGIWMYSSGNGESFKSVSTDDLISRISTDAPARQTPAIFELTARGEATLPQILEGFSDKQSGPHVQERLAESVYRMRPTLQTVRALEQMARQTAGSPVGQRVQALYADMRLRCPETRSQPPEQEQR